MSLIQKQLKDIEIGGYFWRKASRFMWIRMSQTKILEMAAWETDGIELYPDEIVLYYPAYDPSPEARKQVEEWTEYEDVHM